MITVYIYTLNDPRNDEVRYVGASVNPRHRLSEHIYDKSNCYRANWIRKLLTNGLRPILFVIDAVDESNWKEREKAWITYYHESGARLTNGTEGGDGMPNPTPEVRAKLSASNRGKKRSLETRFLLSAKAKERGIPWAATNSAAKANTGRKRPPEVCQKIAEANRGEKNWNYGKSPSLETRAKMSAKRRGENHPLWGTHHSDDTKEKIRQANTGKKMSNESRLKISQSTKGKQKSAETRARMTAAWVIRRSNKNENRISDTP